MSEFQVSAHMQRHDLHKLSALGNDFLVWFRPTLPADAAERAIEWCDRRRGIGADGLIIAIDDRRQPVFVLFNSDGSRAEVSGNGLRCFGQAIARHRGLAVLELDVVTDAGIRRVQVSSGLKTQCQVEVEMGAASQGPDSDSLNLDGLVDARRIDTVDMGNPHIVIEVDDIAAYDMAVVGPSVEEFFAPTGINVHLVSTTEAKIDMAIWERGAGVTQACGSGACAAATAGRSKTGSSSFVVNMPGGSVEVTHGETIRLLGNSDYIAAVVPAPGDN